MSEPPVGLTLATLGPAQFRTAPFEPGCRPAETLEAHPMRACLALSFVLTDGFAAYDAAQAAAVKAVTGRCEEIRRNFASSAKWKAVLGIETRLRELTDEQKHAEGRAKAEAVRVRQAIVANDRGSEAAAAAAAKNAQDEAVAAAGRAKIVAEQLPHARHLAIEELRSQIEAARAEMEASARAQAKALAAELTAAVAAIAMKLVAANTRAGVASRTPAVCLHHRGPTNGLVAEFAARLPH